MDATSAGLILREFGAHRAGMAGATKRWRWADGTLCFPEAVCPWCGAAMRSNRIWLVSEQAKRLVGQVALVGGRLVREPPEHPHVRGTAVCMGGARDVATALFLAMSAVAGGAHSHWRNDYPASWKQRWHDWQVKVFDHGCEGDGSGVDRRGKLVVQD